MAVTSQPRETALVRGVRGQVSDQRTFGYVRPQLSKCTGVSFLGSPEARRSLFQLRGSFVCLLVGAHGSMLGRREWSGNQRRFPRQ